MLVAVVVALIAAVVGIFGYTSIPTELGLYSALASFHPPSVGLTPALTYGIPWGFTWDEFYQQNLTGQTAMVTGANSGIGLDLASSLAKVGADVVMLCRNPQKCHDAKSKILQEETPIKGNIITMTMDTASLASVRALAEAYISEHGNDKRIDFLFLNAGVASSTDRYNKCPTKTEADQLDYHFQVNYLSHHLLYHLLKPFLSEDAKIVQTSSASSFVSFTYKVATDLETLHGCSEPQFEGGGSNSALNLAYGQSKLAQILWVKKLTRLLEPEQSKIRANAFHPGLTHTPGVGRMADSDQLAGWEQVMLKHMLQKAWQSPDGALTGLYLATGTSKNDIRGRYFHPQSQEVVNPMALDEKLQDDVWAFSDELVKAYMTPIQVPSQSTTSSDADDDETTDGGGNGSDQAADQPPVEQAAEIIENEESETTEEAIPEDVTEVKVPIEDAEPDAGVEIEEEAQDADAEPEVGGEESSEEAGDVTTKQEGEPML
ncbi:Short-chain dehydrogenase TIC 32, chloroplastic [Seminavis robusta]|uniref:Short-chain dehydrogenase TIC 32, chloroplastic n=1 Tax=Seminavis robusta TaxID=568900 RepID=A0A9N8E3I9_9STRA|nr:Short-chain dehydrogenase TIC 32, chloroplastic [Seminavis robusta]|eukprot:Sro582_g170500.1 Short-chain dehydrogenase TIC 32, chloroplastic (489) ;mRNA; f:27420-28886